MSRRITNRTNLRAFLLDTATLVHGGADWKPTRVSESYLDLVEEHFKAMLRRSLKKHPPQGKTIQDLW